MLELFSQFLAALHYSWGSWNYCSSPHSFLPPTHRRQTVQHKTLDRDIYCYCSKHHKKESALKINTTAYTHPQLGYMRSWTRKHTFYKTREILCFWTIYTICISWNWVPSKDHLAAVILQNTFGNNISEFRGWV